jgi:hypothetical protein
MNNMKKISILLGMLMSLCAAEAATEYVKKGSSITFSAGECCSDWSKSGNCITINANDTSCTITGNSTGTATVTVKDTRNNSTCSTYDIVVYEITTTTAVTVNDPSRKKLGVGESVNLSLSPSQSSIKWQVSGGGTLTNDTSSIAKFTAGNSSATATISLYINNKFISNVSFTIVEPTTTIASNAIDLSNTIASNLSGVLMEIQGIKLNPTDVSFHNVRFTEVSGSGTATGCFVNNNYHNASGYWWNGTRDATNADQAGFVGTPAPWTVGMVTFNIPYKWKLANNSSEKTYCHIQQSLVLANTNGKSIVSKFGFEKTRTP